MKIAVIDHIGNPGGGSRVARALLPSMKKIRPDLQITFFGNSHAIRREELREVAETCGIKLQSLSSVKFSGKDLFNLRGSRHLVSLIQRKLHKPLSFAPFCLSGAVHKELEARIKDFDLAFFTWPFHLKRPKLHCPMAGIFHDFCFKYYFSGHTLLSWVSDFLNREMPDWLAHATPIVSTQFMKTEVAKFYPEFAHKVKVVPIAPMSLISKVDREGAIKRVKRFKIPTRYLLCPTNISSHKNVGPLLSALPLLKKKGHDIVLVFVGSGTEIINGHACSIGIEVQREPKDVFGLGYVSNEEVDALIQCASIVINPSLYEGGNGAGFDAWAKAVPVAMSNIPPFLEHLSTYNVKAAIFDPRSPADIAEKLHQMLSNPLKTQEEALLSQRAICQHSWDHSAEEYLKVFDAMLL